MPYRNTLNEISLVLGLNLFSIGLSAADVTIALQHAMYFITIVFTVYKLVTTIIDRNKKKEQL